MLVGSCSFSPSSLRKWRRRSTAAGRIPEAADFLLRLRTRRLFQFVRILIQLNGDVIALYEVGVPFEAKLTSLHQNAHHSPEYVAINPEAKVPTLMIDGRPLTEVAATLWYLGRRYPEAGLLPQFGDIAAEARVISWMS